MSRDVKKLETEGFSDEFKEYLKATPEGESAPVRRNMAIGAWLAKQTVHGKSPEQRAPREAIEKLLNDLMADGM